MEKEQIEKHYNEVKEVISEALDNSFAKEYNSEEENAFAQGLKEQLSKLNETFKAEIDELEQASEWDKFCISFFGETNAGKSTIIESLRIIYNEESRLQKILDNQGNLKNALTANSEAYSSLVEQTEQLKKLIKGKKKTVSVKTLVISVVLTAIFAPAILLVLLALL